MTEQWPGKLVTLLWTVLSFGDDTDEVFSQHERNSFAVYAKLLLSMVEEVTEVDVKHLPQS